MEISANTASVIGEPITAAVPVTRLTPSAGSSMKRRTGRASTGARILAICGGDAIELRHSVFSRTLPGRIVARRRIQPAHISLHPIGPTRSGDHVLTVGTQRWVVDGDHAVELRQRLAAAGWLTGSTPHLRAA